MPGLRRPSSTPLASVYLGVGLLKIPRGDRQLSDRSVYRRSDGTWVNKRDDADLEFAYYRELQEHLGRPARKFLREETPALYLWVRERREGAPDETWRESMQAWNRGHSRKYKNESNFHKDFHRIRKAVEKAKEENERLRDQALNAELEAGLESASWP